LQFLAQMHVEAAERRSFATAQRLQQHALTVDIREETRFEESTIRGHEAVVAAVNVIYRRIKVSGIPMVEQARAQISGQVGAETQLGFPLAIAGQVALEIDALVAVHEGAGTRAGRVPVLVETWEV